MTTLMWLEMLALLPPTIVVAGYPLCALLAVRRSRCMPVSADRSLSIVVPLKGLDEAREQVLGRLLDQQVEAGIEWIFCVEDPSDAAVPALRVLAAEHSRRVRLLITGPSGRRLGKLHNLMAGVAASTGENLVFVDGDTLLPHSQFLREFTAPLSDPRVGLVTCWPAYRRPVGVPAAMLAASINQDLLGYFSYQSLLGGLRLANGSCLAVRREVLERIGGLGPQQCAVLMDVILAQRVRAAGLRVTMHAEPVEVPCRTVTWRVWWNQAHRWQVGMARVLSHGFYALHLWLHTAFPLALFLALFGSGSAALIGGFAVAIRFGAVGVVGQVFVRDRAQLRYLWMQPFVDLSTALGGWYAVVANRVEWRDRVYRVLPGGVTRRLA